MKLGIKPHSSITERLLYYKMVRGSDQWTAKVGTEYIFSVTKIHDWLYNFRFYAQLKTKDIQ